MAGSSEVTVKSSFLVTNEAVTELKYVELLAHLYYNAWNKPSLVGRGNFSNRFKRLKIGLCSQSTELKPFDHRMKI